MTNNGKTQGIYLSNGLIYINGEFIKAGTVQANKIVLSSDITTRLEFENTAYNSGVLVVYDRGSPILRIEGVNGSTSSDKWVYLKNGNGVKFIESLVNDDEVIWLKHPGFLYDASRASDHRVSFGTGYFAAGYNEGSGVAYFTIGNGALSPKLRTGLLVSDGITSVLSDGVLYQFKKNGIYRDGSRIA